MIEENTIWNNHSDNGIFTSKDQNLRYKFSSYLFLIGLLLPCQIFAVLPDLIPFRKAQLWGFCNADEKLVIPAKFDAAWPFQNGLAKVKKGALFGMISASGNWVLPADYDAIHQHHLLKLQKGQKYGLADPNGKLILPTEYDGIFPIRDQFFLLLKAGKKGLMDNTGRLLIPLEFDHIAQLRDSEGNFVDLFETWEFGLRGIYDICGSKVQHARFARIDIFREGFAIVQEAGRFGLIDLEGNISADCQFEQLVGPSEGLVAAKVKNRWGFINVKGDQVLPFLFEEVQENGFYKGRAAVKQADQWQFIQRDGQIEFPVHSGFQSIGQLSEGMAAVCSLMPGGGIQYGYADPDGKLKIPFRYERAGTFSKGFAIVGARKEKDQSIIREMRYGVINDRGNEIIPISLHSQTEARLKRDSLGHLGFTTLKCRGKQCRVDYRGRKFGWKKTSLNPAIPKALGQACGNSQLAAVQKKGKWGFQNQQGKVVIPYQYALVQCFLDGLALVWPHEGSSECFYIDETGKAYYSPN